MNKLIPILLCGALSSPLFHAAAATPAQTEEAGSTLSSGGIVLKNKSSFAVDESGRSPFWPIGWKPAPSAPNGTVERFTSSISPASFVVTSITVESGGRYAIINGKVMSEGQVFGLQVGSEIHQITVKAIQDGQVVLLQRDQEIAVPLRRR